MSQNLERLNQLFAEIFQLDHAELDFGIYRIMNAKRDEITRFLDNDLLPQVREAFQAYEAENRVAVEAELAEAIEKAKELGADPETLPRVKELRAKLAKAVDVTALENEVYSHLYNFFRRYYQEGDFISQRRYKEGVYAIPYEGEEVKLYWANHDQYYIKTSEYLRDYVFKLPSGRRVHFKLAQANTEKDNNRAPNGNERRFILSQEQPLAEEKGELVIRFDYRAHPDKAKQADLNAAAVERILSQSTGFDDWRRELGALRPTEKNPNRTLLEKHLTDYTARNTFDYFIHKDLGGFLRRELDFYIKNEVMHLDDIESETAPRVEQYLSKIKAIRRIAHKIIDFLAQIENFEKKLWLKKKFVVETQYCITLDRIFAIEDDKARNWLIDEIVKNDAQREEWVRLSAIDEVKDDLATPGYSIPLKPEFLKVNPALLVDTRHFDQEFRWRLLATFDDIDGTADGILIHGENFQALSLLHARFRQQVKCIYIDPPYNTVEGTFAYKNNYKHSSWAAMMATRLAQGGELLEKGGVIEVAIDDTESSLLRMVLDAIYGPGNYVSTIAAEVNPAGQNLRPNAPARSHDYCHVYANNIEAMEMLHRPLTAEEEAHYVERDGKGPFLWDNLRRRGGNSRPIDRPNQWYPLYVNIEQRKVSFTPFQGSTEVWPIDPQGEKRIWRVSPEAAKREIEAGEISVITKAGRPEVVKKTRMPEGKKPKTLWDDPKYSATTYGTKLLNNILGRNSFSYPKSVHLVKDCIRFWADESALVVDFFAGSATTGHAVLQLNREDGGSRRYVLVEMGEYFDSVLLPRMKKVVYTDDWKDGKPLSREGVSHMFKVIRLESYEDALNNLELRRTDSPQMLLNRQPAFREDYMLRYMLDVESRESPSLLNIERFEDPFNYKLDIAMGTAGETKPTVVDLVETFNYLIGLRVKTIDHIGGVRVVTGLSPEGERVLILWRKIKELNSDALDAWFQKQGYNTKDQEYDLIYVNGDNNLENLRRPDQTWKVRLTEQEFKRLMFDVQDV